MTHLPHDTASPLRCELFIALLVFLIFPSYFSSSEKTHCRNTNLTVYLQETHARAVHTNMHTDEGERDRDTQRETTEPDNGKAQRRLASDRAACGLLKNFCRDL